MLLGCAPIARAGGWQWQSPVPTGNTILDLCFPDSLHGWAVGEFGLILHTSDGGSSWRPQISGAAVDLYAVWFADDRLGWAAGGEDG